MCLCRLKSASQDSMIAVDVSAAGSGELEQQPSLDHQPLLQQQPQSSPAGQLLHTKALSTVNESVSGCWRCCSTATGYSLHNSCFGCHVLVLIMPVLCSSATAAFFAAADKVDCLSHRLCSAALAAQRVCSLVCGWRSGLRCPLQGKQPQRAVLLQRYRISCFSDLHLQPAVCLQQANTGAVRCLVAVLAQCRLAAQWWWLGVRVQPCIGTSTCHRMQANCMSAAGVEACNQPAAARPRAKERPGHAIVPRKQ